MTKHPTDRKERLAIKRQKYEEQKEALQGKASALRKRTEWLKLQEAEDELRAAYSGDVGGQLPRST